MISKPRERRSSTNQSSESVERAEQEFVFVEAGKVERKAGLEPEAETKGDDDQHHEAVPDSGSLVRRRPSVEVDSDNPFYGVATPMHSKPVSIRDWW